MKGKQMQLKTRFATMALALLPLTAAANVSYSPISGYGLTSQAAHQQMVSLAYQTCPAGTTIMLHEIITVPARPVGFHAKALLSCHADLDDVPPGTKPGLTPGH